MTADKILGLLAGHDSKQPMSFDDLVAASGLEASTLEMVLEQMHRQLPAAINCAQITRGGKTQWWYWPTGVVDKLPPFNLPSSPAKKPAVTTAPPRIHCPDLSRAVNEMAQKAINHMEQTVMEPEKAKSKGAAMLELLAEKREATYQQLLDASGAKVVDSFIKGKLKRGLVIRDGRNYRVAENATAEMLLADTRKQNQPPTRKQPEVEPIEFPPANINNTFQIKELHPREIFHFPLVNVTCISAFVDECGQLVIQTSPTARLVFLSSDTLRIKRLLAAIDLESLANPAQSNRSHNDHPA